MDRAEFLAVVARYPFLEDGLPDHADEVLRIAEQLLIEERTPIGPPELPDDAPEWEKAYWRRRRARVIGTCHCGQPIIRGTGNTSTRCGRCAKAGLVYEDGLRP